MSKAAQWLTGIPTPRTLGAGVSKLFGGGNSSTPTVPAVPAPPPPPPMLNSPQGAQAATDARKRAAAANGYGSTLITGPQGLVTPATTGAKELTGS